jgi:F-box-like
MSILSLLQESEPDWPHLVKRMFRDDRLYRYLNVYPLKGLSVGSLSLSNHNANLKRALIYRLPTELLIEIFRHTLQVVDQSRPSPSLCIKPYSRTTPFFLGQICSHWRTITLSTGDLWQSIFISPPRWEHIPLIRLWLERAGECPLSLWLFQSPCPEKQELQATHEILLLLVDRIRLWRNINVRFSKVVHEVLLGVPHGSAVSLEAARVDVREWDQTSADMLWRSIHSSPSLRRPDWVNRYRYGPPSHAPWTQLTHITLDGLLSPDVVLNILQHCHNAIDLTLPHLVSSTAPSSPASDSPFILSHLRHMRISTETELESLLQNLLLPSLESLNITYRRGACNPDSSLHLDELVSRSQCQLRKLTLSDTNTNSSEETIIAFLRAPALQSLIELQLFNTVSDKTIRLLTKLTSVGKEQLLPHLQVISLTCCTSDGELSMMVLSRLPTIRTVRVSLRHHDHEYQQDRARLNYIRRDHDVEVEVS